MFCNVGFLILCLNDELAPLTEFHIQASETNAKLHFSPNYQKIALIDCTNRTDLCYQQLVRDLTQLSSTGFHSKFILTS